MVATWFNYLLSLLSPGFLTRSERPPACGTTRSAPLAPGAEDLASDATEAGLAYVSAIPV